MSASGRASFNGPKPLNLPSERGYCRVEWQGERFARLQLLWKFNRPLYAALMRLREQREGIHAYVSGISRELLVPYRSENVSQFLSLCPATVAESNG